MDNITLNRSQRRHLDRYLGKSFETMSKDELIAQLDKIISSLEPNFIVLSDAYKYSHHKFYTPGLTKLSTYLESRGGKFQEIVMFGIQYILKKYFVGRVISEDMVQQAYEKLNGENGVFGKDGSFSLEKWLRLVEKYDGRMPIEIKAVPEGTVVPVKNVLMMIENTDDEFPWLTSFIESIILQVWYPITVATLSREVKKTIAKYLFKTGTPIEKIPMMIQFILNDFGFRGVSSVESASIGGAAHLINFMGSDNVVGSEMLIDYYGARFMYGKSIDATEHSICTMEGEEFEIEVFRRVLANKPTGLVACVSDSYNILRACEYWGTIFKEIILTRNGVLVIRPDSGDPVQTLLAVFKILFKHFGYTTNEKGFKVLPPQVRVIQGDGVNYESIGDMYQALMDDGIAAENLVLGMGGKLLQANIDRDTQNFAIKAHRGVINGKSVNIIKSPTEIGSDGKIKASFKKSKTGNMKLVKDVENNTYFTATDSDPLYKDTFDSLKCELVTIFKDGYLLVDEDVVDIRSRAELDYSSILQ